ncbi:MAG: DUF386 family protein [Erysipelotrichaceae bacterium]|nr:DUF386 family protein [Erysipelotrichaceae bacterium]
MIFDNGENIDRYFGINKNIDESLNFIKSHRFDNNLKDGKYIIIENEVFVSVMSVNTKEKESGKPEVHFKYMDIQYVINGEEKCYIGKTNKNITSNDQDIDFIDTDINCEILVKPDEFYMVYPYEPHLPTCNIEYNKPIRKMVVKVKI